MGGAGCREEGSCFWQEASCCARRATAADAFRRLTLCSGLTGFHALPPQPSPLLPACLQKKKKWSRLTLTYPCDANCGGDPTQLTIPYLEKHWAEGEVLFLHTNCRTVRGCGGRGGAGASSG